MKLSRNFLYVTVADFLARSAYQTGKTPLLPLFAAALGASDAFLGIIVSVSTLTGMVFKPFIGILSDRWGRRSWLLAGTAFFAIMPFVYQLITTPEQLFWVRIVHGMATAIYGPVTLAYVAEQTEKRTAESFGWFNMARSAGYIIGPAAAGWLLLTMEPANVFTIIGIVSLLAFIPVLRLSDSDLPAKKQHRPLRQQVQAAFQVGNRTPAIWVSGGLESAAYVVLYAVKAFLPIYALTAGFNTAIVGLFFAVQEAAHMLLNPLGGRLGDRFGHSKAIIGGMVLLGAALPLLPSATTVWLLLGVTLLMGISQAFIFTSTVALVSDQLNSENLGAGMGIIGTLQNGGKVIGPILGGLLITRFGYEITFYLLGGLLLLGTVFVWLANKRPFSPHPPTAGPPETAVSSSR